ncbi:T9SS C-terminal target domain-containing protein [Hymenobacter sediminis]|uniref:T9SS type A sorting domain-containing protein n=1 Tax=Hymenobacter sediminis TaxID=2218621 RepID=UPI000F4E44ED|nr:T9SS type A sorting domain-containing protein [Hymenobacter sediminis]RPD44111.1 T9SS C-terminal target domain-containing protein [Hymenobacter sediminis]
MALTQNSPSDYSYTTTSSTGYSPRVYGASADFSINGLVSSSQWTPITGTFKPTERKTYYVNIGNFQQSNPPASQPQTQVYHYVDAVGIYKIPTAGPAVSTCPDTPVTIGTNCGIPGAMYVWSIAGTNMPYVPSVPQIRVQPTATTTYTLTVTLPNQETRTSSVTVTVVPAPTPAILLSSIDKCAKRATYQIMNYNAAYTYSVTPSNGLTLQQSNPISASFSIQGASTSSGGSFTLTRTGCGTSTTTTYVDFTTPSPGGYYTSGYGPSYSNPVALTTYQYIDITNPQGGYVNMQLTNTPYTYSFTADMVGLYLANTTGKWTQFILKPGQAVNITATALNSPCPEVGRFVFIASKGTYGYRVAPNPVSDEVTVTANESSIVEGGVSSNTEFEAELYDRFGKQMKSQKARSGKAIFDVRDFPEGLYQIRVGKGKNAVSERIQVTH